MVAPCLFPHACFKRARSNGLVAGWEASWDILGAFWGHLGAVVGPPGAILEGLEGLEDHGLGPCWGILGAMLGHLGALGRVLRVSQKCLRQLFKYVGGVCSRRFVFSFFLLE